MVKDGYKQTDIGLIPEDWEVKQIKDFTDGTAGGTPSTGNRNFWGGNIKWMSSGELNKKVIFDVEGRITEEGLNNSSTKLIPIDCILIGLAGQGKTRGTVAINKVSLCTNQSIAAIYPNQDYISKYLYYNLERRYNELRSMSTGDGGRGGLNLTIIRNIRLALPQKQEQKAIAKALSDTDELIASLEKLISKKEAIKQGTMQQLLTGKKRLSGFSGEWNSYTIEEIAINLDNLRIPLNENQRSRMRGDIPYCGANGVVGFVNDYVIDDDILLMAEDGGYFDEWATRPIVYRMIGKCWVNNHAHILKAKESFSQDYLFYSLVHKDITKFLASGTRAKLNKSEMYKIQVIAPEDIKEQQSIAQILSDMDNEIESLKAKLSKTKAIKDGMMSELLTGKTRLVS